MTEARRRAEAELERIAKSDDVAWRESATEAINKLLESLAASYHELETALADKVELSKKALARWQADTREFLGHLAEIRAMRIPSFA
jgi:selenocysteine lyase/cysteine desulfurase